MTRHQLQVFFILSFFVCLKPRINCCGAPNNLEAAAARSELGPRAGASQAEGMKSSGLSGSMAGSRSGKAETVQEKKDGEDLPSCCSAALRTSYTL